MVVSFSVPLLTPPLLPSILLQELYWISLGPSHPSSLSLIILLFLCFILEIISSGVSCSSLIFLSAMDDI